MLDFIFTEATLRFFTDFGSDRMPDIVANVSDNDPPIGALDEFNLPASRALWLAFFIFAKNGGKP